MSDISGRCAPLRCRLQSVLFLPSRQSIIGVRVAPTGRHPPVFRWVPPNHLLVEFRSSADCGGGGSIFVVDQSSKGANGQTTRLEGAQPRNRNAWKHGKRSAEALLKRKLARAELKAMAFIGLAIGIFPKSAVRNRPLRADQLALLRRHRPLIAYGLADPLACVAT